MAVPHKLLALALVLGLAACGANGGGPVNPGQMTTGGNSAGGVAVDTITVGDNFFSPRAVTISTGQSVVWVWTGANQHSVTFNDSTIAGSAVQSTATTGTFAYFCSVHGAAVMSGTVTVQ